MKVARRSIRSILVFITCFLLGAGCPATAPPEPSDDAGQPIPEMPAVVRAVALDTTTMRVTFNMAMEEDVGMTGYYQIESPLMYVLSATPSADRTTVVLETSPQSAQLYRLTVGDLMSDGGLMIDPDQRTVEFFGIGARDVVAPRVLSAVALDNTSVLVAFSEPVTDGAATISYYDINTMNTEASDEFVSEKLMVSGCAMSTNHTEALLTTLPQSAKPYHLDVSGVRDIAGNALDSQADSTTFTGIEAPDGESPRVVGVVSTSNTSIVVTFDEPMAESAEVPRNYIISQSNVVTEAGRLIVTNAGFMGEDKTTVALTTLSQSELRYELTVVNVTDLSGNPLTAEQHGASGGAALVFLGTGASMGSIGGGAGGGGGLIDTDGDGLSDDVEQRGWVVVVVRGGGATESRDVTSDPFTRDTDGDGIDDRQERSHATDPRNTDTDADLLPDGEELTMYYSSPLHQDSDADGIDDHSELMAFKTSLIRSDTDGDGFDDRGEIFELNRDPRIADLPRPRIDVGNMALRLDQRFTFTDTQGVTRSSEESSSAELTESQSRTLSFSDTHTTTNVINASTEIGNETEIGLMEGGVSTKFSFKVSAGFSYSDEKTMTVSRESAESAQQSYQDSLTTSETVDETQEVIREVTGASMDVALTVGNVGDIAFSMTNLEVTALQQDPLDRTQFIPVATLIPASTLATGVIPRYTTGPFIPQRGPFLFSSREIFPSLVEDLLRSPRGLVFRVANFDVEDEFGRNLAFTSQEVNDRTAGLTIDYGNGRVDRYRVATGGSFDEQTGRYLGGFDAAGKQLGLPMGYVLRDLLGMEKNKPANAITVGDDGCAQTWASGNDIQVVTPVCPSVAPGGVIITAGPNGRIESVPRGDDLRSGDELIDGGDGCAHSVASGDDVTVVQGACASGDKDGVVVLCGSDGTMQTDPDGDDQLMTITGYATSMVSRCDGDTVQAIVDPVELYAETVAVGDDIQVIIYGKLVDPGNVLITAGPDGVLDSTPNGNDELTLDGLSIVEPERVAQSEAQGDDVQEVPLGSAATKGQVIISAGPNGVMDTSPAGNDRRVGPGYVCGDNGGCPTGACRHGEVLARVKGVENDTSSARFWVLMTEADIDLGSGFDDIVMRAGDTFSLAYVQDKDDDRMFAREEFLYGSSDRRINSDGCPDPADPADPGFMCNDPSCEDFDTDCLTDYEEAKVGWEVAVEGRSSYTVFSDPVRPDSDADTVLDGGEWLYGVDPTKVDTDGDGLTDGAEIYGFVTYSSDGQTVIRYADPFESRVIVDGGNAVVETNLAGDDVLVADSPDAGDVIIAPGENGIVDSVPDGDDVYQPTQVIIDGGNGKVESTPVGDDTLAAGAGELLVRVTFESLDVGEDDCDADDAVVGQCDAASTNYGQQCLNDSDCLGQVGGVCGLASTGFCGPDSMNAEEFCSIDEHCVDQIGTCSVTTNTCEADSQNAGVDCDSDDDCIGLMGICEFPMICDAHSVNAGNNCVENDDCVPTPAACDLPDGTCQGGTNEGTVCVDNSDCVGGGWCARSPNVHPAGEYTFLFNVTKHNTSGGDESVLEELATFLPFNGGDGSVLLGIPANFNLKVGETFAVTTIIREEDEGVDSDFERSLPGGETPPDWMYQETFAYTDLTSGDEFTRTVFGPQPPCFCCFDDDAFVVTVRVGGTVRQGGVIIRPGADGVLSTTPGGDDAKATPHRLLMATDPLNADTDGDSLTDGWERKLGANPNDPTDVGRYRDTDRDGLTDGQETDGWFVGYKNTGGALLCRNADGEFIVVADPQDPPAACARVTSDRFEPDTDGDGLPDVLEMVLRTDPRDRDTDGDSLLDFDEFDAQSESSIHYADFRTFQDLCEPAERCAYDATGSELYGTNLVRVDTDSDGLADAEELFGGWVVAPCGMVPYYAVSNATEADADLDGWGDAREKQEATDPNNADTDGDAATGGGIDSDDPFPASCGKIIQITFVSWSVGDDDCDGWLKGAGDFSYYLYAYRDGDESIAAYQGYVNINSDGTFWMGLSSNPFALTPGQSITVSGHTDEDDVLPGDEPPTWHFSQTFEYDSIANQLYTFTNGPDCFGDDVITVRIEVTGG